MILGQEYWVAAAFVYVVLYTGKMLMSIIEMWQLNGILIGMHMQGTPTRGAIFRAQLAHTIVMGATSSIVLVVMLIPTMVKEGGLFFVRLDRRAVKQMAEDISNDIDT